MKTCKKCGESKLLDAFYKHPKARDGRSGFCKACKLRYLHGKYERKREILLEGQKRCPRCKEVKSVKEFGVDVARKPLRGDGVGRQTYCKACWPRYQQYRRRDPEVRFVDSQKKLARQKTPVGRHRHYARMLTSMAIRFGYLVPKPCEVCGTPEGVQAHHTQYDKPLDGLRWLCEAHHLSHGHDGDWTKPPV